jgi:predicted RecB family endonuclease
MQALGRSLPPLNTRLGVSVVGKSKTKKEVSLDDLCLKRDEALERVVEIFLKGYDEEEEELIKALDVLTVAHTKATFEQFGSSFSS